jgi:hypothetical protein
MRKFQGKLVGAKGFEPSTPRSRTEAQSEESIEKSHDREFSIHRAYKSCDVANPAVRRSRLLNRGHATNIICSCGALRREAKRALSKRARSTTPTSLRFRINELRAVRNSVAQNPPSNPAALRCVSDSAVYRRTEGHHSLKLCQTSQCRSITYDDFPVS